MQFRMNEASRDWRWLPLLALLLLLGGSLLVGGSVEATHAPVPIYLTDPFESIDPGINSAPALLDMDADGDVDLLVGEEDGFLNYYENTGSVTDPVYVERTGPANPFDGVDVGQDSSPAVVDIDADGDSDIFVGEFTGIVLYYENTGSAASPVFTERTGAANPFNGMDFGGFIGLSFADIDGDSDFDVLVGNASGQTSYLENTGTVNAPTFVEIVGPTNPFNEIEVDIDARPEFVDMEGDGDMDLYLGENDGTIDYYENIGTPTAPQYFERPGILNPLMGFDIGNNATPRLADLDGDGDLDAVVGEFAGNLNFFGNVGTATSPFIFEVRSPLIGVNVGAFSVPIFEDMDADGDPDLFIGGINGTIAAYENWGSATSPAYQSLSGPANPLDGIDVGNAAAPTLVDLDSDNDWDAVIGNQDGELRTFLNTGSAAGATYTELLTTTNPFNGVDVGNNAIPAFIDIDADNDPDAFIGARDGTILFYENTGSPTSATFTQRTGAANPFDGVDVGDYAAPTFVDIDQDGTFDAVIGADDGLLYYFENTGTALSPTFTPRTGVDNPLDGYDVGARSAPDMVDIDGDGDPDAFVGESTGFLRYLEATPFIPPVIPTPTPTNTPTSTPTPTATSTPRNSPTPTASPTLTPSPTPDLRRLHLPILLR